MQRPGAVWEPQHRQDLLLHLTFLVRLEPPVEEAGGGGLRWWRLLLCTDRAPAVPGQLTPSSGRRGCGQGRPQWRGPAAAAQQPPPPAQPLRPPSQPRHPRPAGLPPRAPRGVERLCEAGERPLWPLARTAPATSQRTRFPFLAFSPYLSWSSREPPVTQAGGKTKGRSLEPRTPRGSLETQV